MYTLKIKKWKINKLKKRKEKKIFRNCKDKLGWQGILICCWKLCCSTCSKMSRLLWSTSQTRLWWTQWCSNWLFLLLAFSWTSWRRSSSFWNFRQSWLCFFRFWFFWCSQYCSISRRLCPFSFTGCPWSWDRKLYGSFLCSGWWRLLLLVGQQWCS